MAPRRPSKPYSRFFSTFFAGLLFLIAGLAGYHLDKRTPLLSDSRWSDGPILEHVLLGVGFLAVSAFFYTRLPRDLSGRTVLHQRVMKYAGRGQSAGVRRRIEPQK